jgi:methionyl-tRNA formyltransferase
MSSTRPSQNKKLVIITASGPAQIYVTNALTREFDIEAVLLHAAVSPPNVKGAVKKGLRTFMAKASRTLFLKLVKAAAKNNQALINVLFDGKKPAFERPELIVDIGHVNSDEALAAVEKLQPDALLVYGTPIVKDRALNVARDIAFNMHTGISPYYRGTACVLWPIVNREPEMLGATLHECTSAVDGGQIFATRQSRIVASDDLYTGFAKAVEVGAELYVETVHDYLDDNLKGEIQDHSLGVEYRGRDLTVAALFRARWSVFTGTLRRYARQQ